MTSKKSKSKPARPQEGLLVLGLARGLPVTQAAREAGYSERTAFRKLEDPEFQSQVLNQRTDFLDTIVGSLSQAGIRAVQVLTNLLEDKSPAIRLSAARSILETGWKMRENLEIVHRIAMLEDYAKNKSA